MPTYPYQQVAADIREKIQTGIYPPGSQLPTRRELCEEYGCSDIVIGGAMRLLREEGYVTTYAGIGVYVVKELPLR